MHPGGYKPVRARQAGAPWLPGSLATTSAPPLVSSSGRLLRGQKERIISFTTSHTAWQLIAMCVHACVEDKFWHKTTYVMHLLLRMMHDKVFESIWCWRHIQKLRAFYRWKAETGSFSNLSRNSTCKLYTACRLHMKPLRSAEAGEPSTGERPGHVRKAIVS